ncbi:MAG: hypothetical protein JWL83_919 [Actinomycetia bacterium]|nr:hypothetical protein [Actinomycetes bacterium]
MADDTILVPARTSRRERLRAQRRRRRARRAIVFVALVAVSGAAVAAAVAYDNANQKPASARPNSPTTDTRRRVIPPVRILKARTAPRVITHAAPLNLWVGGDSIAGEIGPALGRIAGLTGVVHTQVDYKVSSGLSSNDMRNWQTRATEQMAQYNPEAVVFEVGTNDASIVNNTMSADGTPQWEPPYRVQVAGMMDTLRGDPKHARTVLWVGAPTMQLSWRDRGVLELNRVMREEAERRAPDVTYVDAYSLFADNGQYSSSIRTLTGNIERVRISDGVHLSDSGATYLGAVLFSLLDSRWNITKHADPSQPINWAESVGSSGNGVSSYTPTCCSSSRRNGSSGSQNTTPDTPAPPPSLQTTAPPSGPNTTSAPGTTPNSTSASTPGSSTPPSSGAPTAP